MSQRDGYENGDRHANGGIKIEEIDGEPEFRRVKMYCEGCGELVDEFEAFADEAARLEEKDPRPLHENSPGCYNEAAKVLGGGEA